VSKRSIIEGVTLTRSRFLVVLLLLVNGITWFYLTATLVGSLFRTFETRLIGYSAYYFSTAVFTLVGGLLVNRVQRLQILYIWTALGVVSSCLPVLLVDPSPVHLLLSCVIWGASVGVGLPSCLSFLSALTCSEERGRISGVILFVAYMALLPSVLFISQAGAVTSFLFLAIWRLFGIVPLRYGSQIGLVPSERQSISYSSVLRDRSFILYFVPWFTFMLVDTMEQPVLVRFFGSDLYNLMYQTEMVVGLVSALLGGFLLDFIGRKRTVTSGFVVLGLGYAVLGLAASASASWIIFSIASGVAWGMLTTMFMLTLWGDLSPKGCEEKYYAIGILPPFLAGVVRAVFAPVTELISISAAFSFASFFLFLAVMPLLMAPETLPEEVLERRRMKRYIERAKRLTKGRISRNQASASG